MAYKLLLSHTVVAILTVGVLAAIFGVTPWSQDHAAKQDLASVNTAQGAAYAKDGKYLKRDDITAAGWLSTDLPEPLTTDANPEGTCYVAVQTSDTGHGFIVNHKDPAPREPTDQESWCNDDATDPDAVEASEWLLSTQVRTKSQKSQVKARAKFQKRQQGLIR